MTVASVGPVPRDKELTVRTAPLQVTFSLFLAGVQLRMDGVSTSRRMDSATTGVISVLTWASLAAKNGAYAHAMLAHNCPEADWLLSFLLEDGCSYEQARTSIAELTDTVMRMTAGLPMRRERLEALMFTLELFTGYLETLGW